MRIPKLPIGQKNVRIKKLRTAKAQGCKMLRGPKALKTPQVETPFNTPVLCIILRRAA